MFHFPKSELLLQLSPCGPNITDNLHSIFRIYIAHAAHFLSKPVLLNRSLRLTSKQLKSFITLSFCQVSDYSHAEVKANPIQVSVLPAYRDGFVCVLFDVT